MLLDRIEPFVTVAKHKSLAAAKFWSRAGSRDSAPIRFLRG